MRGQGRKGVCAGGVRAEHALAEKKAHATRVRVRSSAKTNPNPIPNLKPKTKRKTEVRTRLCRSFSHPPLPAQHTAAQQPGRALASAKVL